MPRTLILMRHAKQSGLSMADHERPLTEEGHEQAHSVGRRLAESGLLPDQVLSSTALRCRETWAGVSAALSPARSPAFSPARSPEHSPVRPPPAVAAASSAMLVDFDEALYNASAAQLLDGIAGIPDEVNVLFVLAHNPGISMLALALAGNREAELEQLREGFSPATTARFEITSPWSTLSSRTSRLQSFERPI